MRGLPLITHAMKGEGVKSPIRWRLTKWGPDSFVPSNTVLEYSNLARWIGLVETNLLRYTFFLGGQASYVYISIAYYMQKGGVRWHVNLRT